MRRRLAGSGRSPSRTRRSVLSSAGLEPDQEAEQSELLSAIQTGIAEALTPHQRRVLVALALNGVPIDVLAERLQTIRGALYKSLHDARRKLRGYLCGGRATRRGNTGGGVVTEHNERELVLAAARAGGARGERRVTCFAELDRYVELELAGVDADAAIPGLRAHLEGCPRAGRRSREPALARRLGRVAWAE